MVLVVEWITIVKGFFKEKFQTVCFSCNDKGEFTPIALWIQEWAGEITISKGNHCQSKQPRLAIRSEIISGNRNVHPSFSRPPLSWNRVGDCSTSPTSAWNDTTTSPRGTTTYHVRSGTIFSAWQGLPSPATWHNWRHKLFMRRHSKEEVQGNASVTCTETKQIYPESTIQGLDWR